jgi:hypothetical protein
MWSVALTTRELKPSKRSAAGSTLVTGLPTHEKSLMIGVTPEASQAVKEFTEATTVWGAIASAINAVTSAVKVIETPFASAQDPMGGYRNSGPADFNALQKQIDWAQDAAGDAVAGNYSKVASKDVANYAVDRATNTLRRHAEQQLADAKAVGLGDAALALPRDRRGIGRRSSKWRKRNGRPGCGVRQSADRGDRRR